jgi:SAM-dependent methyltransferase
MQKLVAEKIVACEEASKLIENYIRSKSTSGVPLDILEAGCGQCWWFNLDDTSYVLTGLDIDKAALDIRKNVQQDLDEIIEGDLRTANLPENKFDVIYSAYVLEHIQESDVVLKNFLTWLKPGGVAVVRIPDPFSVRGFLTRITPHWFHVWVHKNVLGDPNAGKPGYTPYPTFYTNLLSRQGLYDFCEQHGFTVKEEYKEQAYYKDVVKPLINLFTWTVGILSFGFLDGRYDNCVYILEKN